MNREIYLLLAGPDEFQVDLTAASTAGIPENPQLRIETVPIRRGDPLSTAVALVGFLSSITGLITFIEWAIIKWRTRSNKRHLSLKIIREDGRTVSVTIEVDDGDDEIRKKLTVALEAA